VPTPDVLPSDKPPVRLPLTANDVAFDPAAGRCFHLHVLFVCTGNICRSPTAERLAAAYCTERQLQGFRASSAGTCAVVQHPIHQQAMRCIEELGGSTADFAARQLTSNIATDADLILTMTRAHRDVVLELVPHRLHRTYTLSEAANLVSVHGARTVSDLSASRPKLSAHEVLDISDPIGQPAQAFTAVASQIAELINLILPVFHPV
jgi:protein-tyrosine phosphatase